MYIVLFYLSALSDYYDINVFRHIHGRVPITNLTIYIYIYVTENCTAYIMNSKYLTAYFNFLSVYLHIYFEVF